MRLFENSEVMREQMQRARNGGRTVGLVPTMGSLHEGHASLLRLARGQCDILAASIFVNPIQFDSATDLAAYPRDLDADLARCEAEGVDVVFAPQPAAMYAADRSVTISEATLSAGLCGASRPGHFDGVCTVVCKLFNIVGPHLAVFGEKDYQQLQVLRRMVRDLDLPVEIVSAPIVRDPDGLAMSSRNARLSATAREQALCLYRALQAAGGAARAGETDCRVLRERMRQTIAAAPLAVIDYAEVVHPETLAPLETLTGAARAMVAAAIDGTRLIDNLALGRSAS